MVALLLDTNVVSELQADSPNQGVAEYISRHDRICISSMTLHEMLYGLYKLEHSKKDRQASTAKLATLLNRFIYTVEEAGWKTLPLNAEVIMEAAQLRSDADGMGLELKLADAFIAATAKTNSLRLVTGDKKLLRLRQSGVDVVNPWGS